MSNGKGAEAQNKQVAAETGADVNAREEAYNKVLKHGATAGVATSAAVGGAILLLQRRMPMLAHASLPFKVFGVLGAGLAGGVIAAENTSVAETRRAYDESVDESQRFSHAEKHTDYSKLSRGQAVLAWTKEYRWSAVAYGWAASMAASMYVVNRQPLDFKQKIVQARIYAQVITIVLLVAAGGLSAVPTAADAEDDTVETRHAIRERAMYKFQEGSEAEKRAKQTEDQLHQKMPELPQGNA